MDSIKKQITLLLPAQSAFEKFVNDFNDWWPIEYTWSGDSLKEISVGNKIGDFCTETGPNGFRVDWGTVTDVQKDKLFSFRWQIGFNRDPIPNPEKASLVTVTFNPVSDTETKVELIHSDFRKHGENYQEYLKALDSEKGWDYILCSYGNYAAK